MLRYVDRLLLATGKNFAWRRIRKYGFMLALYDQLIFLCHRSNSGFEQWLWMRRDRKVQKYLYQNYKGIIERYRDSGE